MLSFCASAKQKNGIKSKLKSERGSITVFVLSTMLLVTGVIFVSYFSMMNKSSSQLAELNKIQEEYMITSDSSSMDQAYAEAIQNYEPKLVRKWVSKVDGNGEEEFLDVKQTSDGGYIAVGYTTSTNISGLTNKGSADCLIAKYDANGNEQWKKSVGGSKYDWYNSVIEITDGTYIAVGTILSTDVVDKNGNNIGHGYDWESSMSYKSMVASEGIIAKYDINGNEISLKTTGEAAENAGDVWINVILSGIDKVEAGNYIVTGKKLYGMPPGAPFESDIMNELLAIKYNLDGNELYITESILNNTSSILSGITPWGTFVENYESFAVTYQTWRGVAEKTDGSYIVFGTSQSPVGGTGLWKSDTNLKNIKSFGDARSCIEDYFSDDDDNYITLNYSMSDVSEFLRIEKQSDSGMIWENTDKVIKSISKSSENNFVGISDDNKFLKYNTDDGSVLEEYDVPTYENVYAIEGKEEFILLGSPTDEEGITITGTSGAVIAKYAIE